MRELRPAQRHLQTAGDALGGWFRAALLDALVVGALWLVGLLWIGVPFAPLWAVLGALFQFVPGIGAVLGVCGPAVAAVFSTNDNSYDKLWWVLGLYGFIAIADGLLIQPLLLKRKTRVPWWAALLGPIVGGILLPPWGALIAPPLLAVFFSLRRRPAA